MALPAGRKGVSPKSVDRNGDIKIPEIIPQYTTEDAGKTLTVNEDGTGLEWKEPPEPPSPPGVEKYVTFTAAEANSTVKLIKSGSGWGSISWVIKVSTDNITWEDYTFSTVITLENIGDFVSFAGIENWTHPSPESGYSYNQFVMTGKINGSGNICGLVSQATDGTFDYCFYKLFSGCESLLTAPDIPAVNAASYCCQSMFENCTNLTTAPETLPALTINSYCYFAMFEGCTSLTTAPELPATTLKGNCYTRMFSGCTSLVSAQTALPATSVPTYAYFSMFSGCSALEEAPELYFTSVSTYGLSSMFLNCASLESIKLHYTGDFTGFEFGNWVDGVSATGDFYYNGTDTTRGTSAIPENWTIHTF